MLQLKLWAPSHIVLVMQALSRSGHGQWTSLDP